MDEVIAAHDLVKHYGPTLALDRVNLRVSPGEVVGLVGPNGAGKTTLLRILVDLIRPTSGQVTVLGKDPRRAGPSHRRHVGYLPGELRLNGKLKGSTLLDQWAKLSGGVDPTYRGHLEQRLDAVTQRPVRTLSKGNKQKLGLIQAFMHQPSLFILDEPSSGLDPIVQQEFLTMVRDVAERGATVMLSSHVLSEVEHIADRVVVMKAGRITRASTLEALRDKAKRTLTAVVRESEEQVRAVLTTWPHLATYPHAAGMTRIEGAISHDIDSAVKMLATLTVMDLTISEPDLEESVLALYSQDQA